MTAIRTTAAERLLSRPKSTNTIIVTSKPLLPLVIISVMKDGSATAVVILTRKVTQRQPGIITRQLQFVKLLVNRAV